MGQRWWLNTEEQIENFLTHVRQRKAEGEPVTVQFVGEERTPDQNGLLHGIMRDVQKQKGDEDITEIKRYIKLHFGVPILRSTDPEFCHAYDSALKDRLTYEEKLEAMDILPVTSIMDTEQFSKMIDSVIRHYTGEGYVIQHSAKG